MAKKDAKKDTKKDGGTNFWLAGAAYWIAVAALLTVVFRLWPELAASPWFRMGAVVAMLAGMFTIVWFLRPKP